MPEALVGGPIALVKDGDKIIIDADTREINWLVDAEEQARRKKEWDASGKNELRVKRGILYKYARDVAVSVLSVLSSRPCSVDFLSPAACERRGLHRLMKQEKERESVSATSIKTGGHRIVSCIISSKQTHTIWSPSLSFSSVYRSLRQGV